MNENVYLPAQKPEKQPVRFTWKDWLFCLAALVLAWLCMHVYHAGLFLQIGPAGLGVPVFTAALLAAVFLRLGKRAQIHRWSVFLTVCTFLTALGCFLCTNPALFFINSFAALGVGILTVFSLSGQLRKASVSAGEFLEALGLFFQAIFAHFGKPFRALGGLFRSDKKHLPGVLLGLICAFPVLAVVLALLSSADAVFGGLLYGLGDWFVGSDLPVWLWTAVRTLFVALLFFSGLYFLTTDRPAPESAQPEAGLPDELPAAPFVTALVLLDLVYLIFAVIQIVYLFGGAETASMLGGYAAYARSGFFQLVAVAAINVCAVLLTALWGKRCTAGAQKALRVLALTLTALTLVILVSAVMRMGLYISVYGLSMLRLLTLWGMLVILASLAAAAWKTLRPGFCFWRVFFLFALVSWILLMLLNPNSIICSYNVDAYLHGRLNSVDVEYLAYDLSFDSTAEALPALRRLLESGRCDVENVAGIIRGIESDMACARPVLYRYIWHFTAR